MTADIAAPRTRQGRGATPRLAPRPKRPPCLQLDLALQGGGAHGAFTWGVLDRLLEDEGIEIAAISGTSAGALNAVALAAGLMQGGRVGARRVLRALWERVGALSPFQSPGAWPVSAWMGDASAALAPWIEVWAAPMRRAVGLWAGQFTSLWSPYQFNPLNLNPLRRLLTEVVDFDQVARCHKARLFIAATRVRTGELRIFRQHELTPDVVLASACLPLLFQAVDIEGEPHWDGGYAGNPSLLPLIEESPADDLLLVQINPSLRCALPVRAADILDRQNEITFNASLLKELRTIALLQQQARLVRAEAARPGRPPDPSTGEAQKALFDRVARLRLHRVEGGDRLAAHGASSKLRTDPPFLNRLFVHGRQAMDEWLVRHRGCLGQRGSFDPSSFVEQTPGNVACSAAPA